MERGSGVFLAAWRDERFGSGDPDVYGARLNAGGQVLDTVSVGFPVSNPTSAQRDPAVASDGSRFFVTWEDNRTAGNGYDIYGGRVDGGGFTLDGSGFPVNAGPQDQTNPALAFNGTYLVAWRSYKDISVGRIWIIWMARVGSDGRVLDPAGFSEVPIDFHHDNASVARGPGNTWGLVFDQGAAGLSSIQYRTVSPK
jgi:hypothetical protein